MASRVNRITSHLLEPQAAANLGVITLEEAKDKGGVRLTMIPGIYAVVVEYVRFLLEVRKVPYTLVAHPREDQSLLYELTSQTSVPTLLVEGDRPRNTFMEQTYMVDSLGEGPSLIPTGSADRVKMFGLMNEIQGEGGLLWNKRFALVPPEGNDFGKKYGWSKEAVANAEKRIVDVLGVLNAQLEEQNKAGSKYFIGSSLTALDLHWAAFSNMVAPGGADMMEMNEDGSSPRPLAAFAKTNTPAIEAACTPLLIAHRDMVFASHLKTPLQLMP